MHAHPKRAHCAKPSILAVKRCGLATTTTAAVATAIAAAALTTHTTIAATASSTESATRAATGGAASATTARALFLPGEAVCADVAKGGFHRVGLHAAGEIVTGATTARWSGATTLLAATFVAAAPWDTARTLLMDAVATGRLKLIRVMRLVEAVVGALGRALRFSALPRQITLGALRTALPRGALASLQRSRVGCAFTTQLFQIQTHGKGAACAGQDDDFRFGIVFERAKRVRDRLTQAAGQRVQRLWPVQRHGRDAAIAFDKYQFIVHRHAPIAPARVVL